MAFRSVCSAAVGALTAVAPAWAAKPDTASFALSLRGVQTAYRDAAAFVLPRARIAIDAVGGPPGDYTLTTTDGTAEQLAARHWRWTAPERAGVATLRFRGPASDDVITLRAFVMVPASAVKNGSLNGYRIGQYPGPRANPLYRPPEGYVEVTRDNQHTRVSPHFELGQFVCKEDAPSAFPKYVVVREQLPLTLEAVLERVEAIGFRADALHIMSAYRTPYYNHAIGDVKYSMHQFGGAADVYVDRMPDVKILFDQVEALMSADGTRPIRGGLGLYPGTTVHPPFVHVDVRGKAARWHG